MNNEIWKDIVITKNGVLYDFTGLYQVSNLGRVKSLNYRRTGMVKIKKTRINRHGYETVNLHKDGNMIDFSVHRLVATMFIENDDPERKTEVNHISEIKTQNDMWNLEWVTPKENSNHGTRIERIIRTRNNNNDGKIVCVETGRMFVSGMDVERKLGLDQGSISKCCHGKQKTCGGYHWMYATDLFIEIHNRVMEKVDGIKEVQLDMLMD